MNARLTAVALALLVFSTAPARADEQSSVPIEASDTKLADPATWGLYAYMLNAEWKGGIGLRRTVKWGEGEQLVFSDRAMLGAPTVLLIEPKAPGLLKMAPQDKPSNKWTGQIGPDHSVTWTHDAGTGIPFRDSLKGNVHTTEAIQFRNGVAVSAGRVVKFKGELAAVANTPTKNPVTPSEPTETEVALASSNDSPTPTPDHSASTAEVASDEVASSEGPREPRTIAGDVLSLLAGDEWQVGNSSIAETATWRFDWIEEHAVLRADTADGYYLYEIAAEELTKTYHPDEGAPLMEKWRRNPDGSISTTRWEQGSNSSTVETYRGVTPNVVHVYRSTLREDGTANRERLVQWLTRADEQNVPVPGSEYELKDPALWGPLALLANRATTARDLTSFYRVSANGDAIYELRINPKGSTIHAILKVTPDGQILRFNPNVPFSGYLIARLDSHSVRWSDIDPRSPDLTAKNPWTWRLSEPQDAPGAIKVSVHRQGSDDKEPDPDPIWSAVLSRDVRFEDADLRKIVSEADALSSQVFAQLHALEVKIATKRRKDQELYAKDSSWARTLANAMDAELEVQKARTQRTLDNLDATFAEAERRARLEREAQAAQRNATNSQTPTSTAHVSNRNSSTPAAQLDTHVAAANANRTSGLSLPSGGSGQSNAQCAHYPIKYDVPSSRIPSREEAEAQARERAEHRCSKDNGGVKTMDVQCRSHQRQYGIVDSKGRATKDPNQPPLEWFCMASVECNATRRMCESGTPGATRQ